MIACETWLSSLGVRRASLAPGREEATGIAALYEQARPELELFRDPRANDVFADGLIATARAIVEHFPNNLFWDLDALSGDLVAEALDEGVDHLEATFEDVVALHALFGRSTPIRFRYVHDFTYGFDWAKWVRRDPSRARSRPFDRTYLKAMLGRGEELLELIADNDRSYPQLHGPEARNPFAFSRDPADEIRLHRELAASDLIPVRAWERRPTPRWDFAFHEAREQRASALDLIKAPEKARPPS